MLGTIQKLGGSFVLLDQLRSVDKKRLLDKNRSHRFRILAFNFVVDAGLSHLTGDSRSIDYIEVVSC